MKMILIWLIFFSPALMQTGMASAQSRSDGNRDYSVFSEDSVLSQQPEPMLGENRENTRLWSVMFQLGDAGGGPFKEIESAMSRSGFGATDPGKCFFFFCSESREHPYSTNGGMIWAVTVTRHLRNIYSASLNYTSFLYADTHGYHSSAGELTLRYSAETIGALIQLGPSDLFTVGLGPVLSFTSTGNGVRSYESTKLGFALDIALKVPRRSTVYGALNFQYKFIHDVEVGPFTVHSFLGSATFPGANVNYSHRSLGLALGFRF